MKRKLSQIYEEIEELLDQNQEQEAIAQFGSELVDQVKEHRLGYSEKLNAQLFDASINGKAELIQSLVDECADLTARIESDEKYDYAELTPLMFAAVNSGKSSNLATVLALIKAGANVNALSSFGRSPLMLTVRPYSRYSTIETVEALLAAGADPNIQDPDDGSTALILASGAGLYFPDLEDKYLDQIPALIKGGAEVEQANHEGETPLMIAAKYGSVKAMQALIQAGANANVKNVDNETALMYAAEARNEFQKPEKIQVLLDAGVDPNIQATNNDTALTLASRFSKASEHLETIQKLVAAGSNLDLAGSNNKTALMNAAASARSKTGLEVVKFLIDAGANQELVSDEGKNALAYCRSDKCRQIFYQSGSMLPMALIQLIFRRKLQQELCTDLSENVTHYKKLKSLAKEVGLDWQEILGPNPTKAQLCFAISEVLSAGGTMTPSACEYLRARVGTAKKYQDLLKEMAARALHIDPTLSIEEVSKIINQLSQCRW